ncbi:hypothetical protein TNCV_489661 [Trichonephila clavipes]|nr:hypothetical protein TNCV_489661 [Trichonephila clavipes]
MESTGNILVSSYQPILQILDGASTVCQDPDTVLIRVESMIERTTNSNEFRSKDGTVVRIPDFNIVPSATKKKSAAERIFALERAPRGLQYCLLLEFGPLKTRRAGERCTLNLLRAQTSSRWCGSWERGCQLRCRHVT